MTVVETERFLRDAKSIFSESEREELITFLSIRPDAGEIIPDTGGVRKIRWAIAGRGKRGGARVIYYFQNERVPLFLLAAFAKNEKANLTAAERSAMKRIVPLLAATYSTTRRPK